MSGRSAGTTAVEPAFRPLGRRPALLLLTTLLLLAAILRLWYLPSSERSASESPAIANVEAVVSGSEQRDYRISPLAWAPQLLTLRVADRMHDPDGGRPPVVTARHRVTRRGLRLVRLLSMVYGLAGAVFLYLLARRLHSTGVALSAALLLCASPWHIQASVAFAPDILVLALSALALWLAMWALDRPSAARLAAVGVALGAAAAAKITGLAVALPVLLCLVFGGRRSPRPALLPLAVAVPVALLTWWLLSPPISQYLAALEIEQAAQVKRAAREASSRFTVVVLGFLYPLFESVHGRLLGGLALLGWAGQAFRCLFLIDPGPARPQRLMVVATVPVFVLGYAWASPLFREGSFVPLLVPSSLYAAVMLGILWQTLRGRLPRPAARWAPVGAGLLVVALAAPPAWSYVHTSAVESTLEGALDWLRRELPSDGPRLVLVEEAAFEGAGRSGMQLAEGLALMSLPRLPAVGEERLARVDAEIFPRRRLEGPDAVLYGERRGGAARRRVVESRLFRRRGPDLVATLRPYGSEAPAAAELAVAPDGRQRTAILPASPQASAVAVMLRLPVSRETDPAPPRVWLDGVEIALAPAGFFPRYTLFLSERLGAAPASRRLQIAPPDWMAARRGEITAVVYSWR